MSDIGIWRKSMRVQKVVLCPFYAFSGVTIGVVCFLEPWLSHWDLTDATDNASGCCLLQHVQNFHR